MVHCTIDMPTSLRLRYQKQTPYKEHVFICVLDEEKPEEEEGFKKLVEICDSLKNQYPGLYLPVYQKENFVSIRFKQPNAGYPPRKFYRDSVYDVHFTIKKRVSEAGDGKIYINAYLNKAKLVRKADNEEGEEIEF